jgi:hypothetical protein
MSNGKETGQQKNPRSTGHGFDPAEVAEAIVKAKPNGRSLLAQLVAILISVGVLGGGGYVGLDVVRSELAHTQQTVGEVRTDVKELRKDLTREIQSIAAVRIEILREIETHEESTDAQRARIWQHMGAMERRLVKVETILEQMRQKE